MDLRRAGPRRVLLVEHSASDAALVREAFARVHRGASVQVVPSAREAATALERSTPDLLLLDADLPGEAGLDLIEFVRARTGLELMPIIVLTATPGSEIVSQAYARGANALVRKPSTLRLFEEKVEAIVRFWCEAVSLPSEVLGA